MQEQMQAPTPQPHLPQIPMLNVGRNFPLDTLERDLDRAHDLIALATKRVPRTAMHALDGVSRRWLKRCSPVHLTEIDAIARRLNRPGTYFLTVNYEWGCTCRVAPSPDRTSARLIRVLDWRTPGLGKHVVAAKVPGPSGEFITLTWPGYTGILQAVAKGRFAAALNQAPMRRPIGLFALDWAANRARVWQMRFPTPAHLLRDVFEHATTFDEARLMLLERPIASPAIFLLSGTKPHETAVIERTETSSRTHDDGPGVAANHWRARDLHGAARGIDSEGRAKKMSHVSPDMDRTFPWLTYPIKNPRTRLVMMADAATGQIIAQGFEADGPATRVLEI